MGLSGGREATAAVASGASALQLTAFDIVSPRSSSQAGGGLGEAGSVGLAWLVCEGCDRGRVAVRAASSRGVYGP